MRQVRIAASAHAFFQSMLEQGAEKFGIPVAQEKERIVHDTLHGTVAEHPHRGRHDERLSLYTYHVGTTPFVLVYEFDEAEVRVLFIVHERADRRRLHRRDVSW